MREGWTPELAACARLPALPGLLPRASCFALAFIALTENRAAVNSLYETWLAIIYKLRRSPVGRPLAYALANRKSCLPSWKILIKYSEAYRQPIFHEFHFTCVPKKSCNTCIVYLIQN